jgi:iron complex transport system substrate-binding protein
MDGRDNDAAMLAQGRDAWSRRSILSGLSLTLLAGGCGQRGTERTEQVGISPGWPRTIEGARGKVTLLQQPRRIVSTSVTLTGTLLTIDAPVIGSAATQGDSDVADAQGFFTQWSSIARERQVKPIYAGEPNVEAVAAMAPDLILVAGTGGDSALRVLDQLSQIAPTLVLDYGDKSWQELALLLGTATGLEGKAAETIAGFDRHVADTARTLKLPRQPTTAMVYYEDGSGANIWTPMSAQGKLLTALGFTLAHVPPHVRATEAMGRRRDVVQIMGEQFADALSGDTILLFAADAGVTRAVRANPFLAHVPAVAGGRVYAMGRDTFRLDYYSAHALLDRIGTMFA